MPSSVSDVTHLPDDPGLDGRSMMDQCGTDTCRTQAILAVNWLVVEGGIADDRYWQCRKRPQAKCQPLMASSDVKVRGQIFSVESKADMSYSD